MCCVQIADAAAPENQPDLTQLGNTTYLMNAFEKLVADLEDPIAVAGSGAVFSYSPCFINVAPSGARTHPCCTPPLDYCLRLKCTSVCWPCVRPNLSY